MIAMTRTRWAVLGVVLLVAQSVGCVSYPARASVGFRETVALDKAVDLDGIRKIVVETPKGVIEIQGDAQRKDIQVEAERWSRGLTEQEARAQAERIRVEVRREPARSSLLRIVARLPLTEPSRDQGVHFRITVPAGPSLTLKSAYGRIEVTDAANDLDIDTKYGDVSVLKTQGKVRARTRHGDVAADQISGELDVGTRHGDIELTEVRADRIKAHTSFGDIRAEQVHGAADLQTRHGFVKLRALSVPERPEIKAITRFGRVEVEVPKTIKARLRMHTGFGDIDADLKGVAVTDLRSEHRTLAVTVNGGGGSINMETRHGSVRFRTTEGGGS